jgi:hypothetical protein
MRMLATSATSVVMMCLLITGALDRLTARQRASTVVSLYTGTDGQTHDRVVNIELKPWPGARSAERSDPIRSADVQYRRMPSGWANDWHPAPARQYVITLSGRGEIELIGGRKLDFGPGSVFLAEDLTGKGHVSRTIGSEDWVSIAIRLSQ